MKIEDVIYISAPKEVVWKVTLDIERWPQWTPSVETIKRLEEGEFGVGSTVLLKQPGLPEAIWVVTECTPGKRFAWETEVFGIRMAAAHEIESDKTGTQNLLRIEMSGLVAVLLWPLIRSKVRRSIENENQGFKKRCEESS